MDVSENKTGHVVIEGVEFINNKVTDVVSYKPPNISQWWNKVHKIDKKQLQNKDRVHFIFLLMVLKVQDIPLKMSGGSFFSFGWGFRVRQIMYPFL